MKQFNYISLFIIFSILPACDSPSIEKNSTPHTKTQTQVFPGKPGAAVELEYTITGQLLANNTVLVEIILMTASQSDELVLTVTSTNGIQTLADTNEFYFTDTASGVLLKQNIEMTILRDGTHYLNLIVKMKHADNMTARSFSIPIVTAGKKQTVLKPDTGTGQANMHQLEERRTIGERRKAEQVK